MLNTLNHEHPGQELQLIFTWLGMAVSARWADLRIPKKTDDLLGFSHRTPRRYTESCQIASSEQRVCRFREIRQRAELAGSLLLTQMITFY